MLIRNVSREDLERALDAVNAKYDGNVAWNNFTREGRSRGGGDTYRVTLKVKSSRGPGGKKGISRIIWGTGPEYTAHACWHVFGNFFAALFGINPNATVISQGRTINKDVGNWVDSNIGSSANPVMFSDACDCYERGIA